MSSTPAPNSANNFHLAIIGCGLISRGAHIPAALSLNDVHLAALIDPVPERAQELAKSYGITPVIARTLDDVDVHLDGAIIATPNHTHRDLALSCFNRNISVLIEKPLANSVSEGQEIVDAARRNTCTVAVGYVSRFRPNVNLLNDLLKRSYFGRVQRFVHQFGTPGGWSPLSAYNLQRETSGGGVLVVTGTHFLDRMLLYWGYPDEVNLQDDSEGGPEANCVATFRFDQENGAVVGAARYSKTVSLPGGLVIETDRGVVVAGDTDSAHIVFRPKGDSDLEYVVEKKNQTKPDAFSPFAEQLADFVTACRSGSSPKVDGGQGLLSLKLIDDLYSRRKPLEHDWYSNTTGDSA